MNSDNETLRDLFLYELQGIYDTEQKLVDALDEMAAETKNGTLSEGFTTHQEETEKHVNRLEQVFAAIGEDPVTRESAVFSGILQEHDEFKNTFNSNDLQDMFHIGAGMKIERNEMTSYDSLIMLAERMNLGDEVVTPLERNRAEEEDALEELQGVASGSKIKSVIDRLTP